MNACDLHLSIDDVLRALDGEEVLGLPPGSVHAHLAECDACRRAHEALRGAKDVWDRAREEAPAAEHARELRHLSAWRRPSRPPVGYALSAAFGVAATLALVRPEPTQTAVAVSPPASVAAPPAAASSPSPVDLAIAPKRVKALVALASKGECRLEGAARATCGGAGAEMPVGATLDLPAGSSILLAFRMEDGSLDESSRVELQGPARAFVAEVGAPALRLVRGTTRLVPPSEAALSMAPPPVASPPPREHAASAPPPASADASAAALLPPPPEPAAPSDDDLLRNARALLHAGNRSGAEAAFREIIDRAQTARTRSVANLAVAELELARGDASSARVRLLGLLRGTDAELGESAAFVLAARASSPRERAETWALYLATSPPSPRREQAITERAEALLAAGDVAGARAALAPLTQGVALPEPTRVRVNRLQNDLAIMP